MDEDMKLLMDKIDALEKQVAALVRLHTPEGQREARLAAAQANPHHGYRSSMEGGVVHSYGNFGRNPWGA